MTKQSAKREKTEIIKGQTERKQKKCRWVENIGTRDAKNQDKKCFYVSFQICRSI